MALFRFAGQKKHNRFNQVQTGFKGTKKSTWRMLNLNNQALFTCHQDDFLMGFGKSNNKANAMTRY
jgi:hypothetical protein